MKDKSAEKQYHIPSFIASSVADSKSAFLARIKNIFEDDKKKKGLVVLIVVLIVALISTSFLVLGNINVKQVNDSLTIYTFSKENSNPEPQLYKRPSSTLPYDVDALVKAYKAKYPDVAINVVEFDDVGDNSVLFYDKLTAELLAGRGPDVIIGDRAMALQKDVEKMIKSGNFAPLDDFIKADTAINPDEFYPAIMNKGLYRGERYVLPLRFTFDVMMASEQGLTDAGINIENCTRDYLGYVQELNGYITENPNEADSVFLHPETSLDLQLGRMNILGANGISNKDTIETKQFFELYKPMSGLSLTVSDFLGHIDSTMLSDSTGLFLTSPNDPSMILNEYIVPESPVIFPIRRSDGGISATIEVFGAINSKSANQQNAYNFISTLLDANCEFYFYEKGLSTNIRVVEGLVSVMCPKNRERQLQFLSYIDEIDNAYFPSPMDKEILNDMQPFFDDEKSYEDCIKEVQRKMELYATE